MARLACRCLNVTVHYKGLSWDARKVEGDHVLPAGCGHRLCGAVLHEVDLDLAGVTTEQASLVLSQTLGDWTVHYCTNCASDVCVTHSEKRRTFVCGGLLATEEDISQVKGHPHYSTVFRITLSPTLEDTETTGRRRASSMTFGRDDPAVKLAHTQVKGFLAREEEDVERRIREFEKRERASFSRLQQRSLTERTLLLAAIGKAKECAASSEQSSHDSTQPPSLSQSTPQPRESVTITLSDKRSSSPNKAPVDDALFSLDGFDEDVEEVDRGKEGVAFPQSDDEEISTDDSSYRDMMSVQLASSAPLGVPVVKPSDQAASSYEGDPAPTDMASSIKALALSVQNTGMFGDLPRPRVNSDIKYK